MHAKPKTLIDEEKYDGDGVNDGIIEKSGNSQNNNTPAQNGQVYYNNGATAPVQQSQPKRLINDRPVSQQTSYTPVAIPPGMAPSPPPSSGGTTTGETGATNTQNANDDDIPALF